MYINVCICVYTELQHILCLCTYICSYIVMFREKKLASLHWFVCACLTLKGLSLCGRRHPFHNNMLVISKFTISKKPDSYSVFLYNSFIQLFIFWALPPSLGCMSPAERARTLAVLLLYSTVHWSPEQQRSMQTTIESGRPGLELNFDCHFAFPLTG